LNLTIAGNTLDIANDVADVGVVVMTWLLMLIMMLILVWLLVVLFFGSSRPHDEFGP
jgi:heme/copper-type cytochrome/quinol oxidase subunit 2